MISLLLSILLSALMGISSLLLSALTGTFSLLFSALTGILSFLFGLLYAAITIISFVGALISLSISTAMRIISFVVFLARLPHRLLSFVFRLSADPLGFIDAIPDFFMDTIPDFLLDCYDYMAVEYWVDETRMFLDWSELACLLFCLLMACPFLFCLFRLAVIRDSGEKLLGEQVVSFGPTTEMVGKDEAVSRPVVKQAMPAVTNFLPRQTLHAESFGFYPDGFIGPKKPVWTGNYTTHREPSFLSEGSSGVKRVLEDAQQRWRWRRSSEKATSPEVAVVDQPELPTGPGLSSSEPADEPVAPAASAPQSPPMVEQKSSFLPQVTAVTPHHLDCRLAPQESVTEQSYSARVAVPQPLAPVALPQPSPEEILAGVYQRLGEHANALRVAMVMFLVAVIGGTGGYAEPGDIISNLIDLAHEELGLWFQLSALSLNGDAFPWSLMMADFWNEVRLRGHFFANHGDPNILRLVAKVHNLSTRLGLQLPPADMTPPSPRPQPAEAAQVVPVQLAAPEPTKAVQPPTTFAEGHSLPSLGDAAPVAVAHPIVVPSAPVALPAVSTGATASTSVPMGTFGFQPSGARRIAQRRPVSSRRPAARPRAPEAPKESTPAVSAAPVVEEEPEEAVEVEAFDWDDLDRWGALKHLEISAVTKEHLGFVDEKRIWRYWGASHLEIDNEESKCSDPEFVQQEFRKIRPAWHRAVWFLVQQAKSEAGWRSLGLHEPQLLPTITAFLCKINQMHKACGGDSGFALQHGAIVLYFDVAEEEGCLDNLRKHYGAETSAAFELAHNAVRYHWVRFGQPGSY